MSQRTVGNTSRIWTAIQHTVNTMLHHGREIQLRILLACLHRPILNITRIKDRPMFTMLLRGPAMSPRMAPKLSITTMGSIHMASQTPRGLRGRTPSQPITLLRTIRPVLGIPSRITSWLRINCSVYLSMDHPLQTIPRDSPCPAIR
jgi:hypothetical protein